MREECESPPLGCLCHFGVEGDENQILQACGTMLHHKKVTCICGAQSHSSIEGLQWFYPIPFGFDPTHTGLNRSPKLPSGRRGLAADQCRFGFNFEPFPGKAFLSSLPSRPSSLRVWLAKYQRNNRTGIEKGCHQSRSPLIAATLDRSSRPSPASTGGEICALARRGEDESNLIPARLSASRGE